MTSKEIEDTLRNEVKATGYVVTEFTCECNSGAARGFSSDKDLCSGISNTAGGFCDCVSGATMSIRDETGTDDGKDEKPPVEEKPDGSGDEGKIPCEGGLYDPPCERGLYDPPCEGGGKDFE